MSQWITLDTPHGPVRAWQALPDATPRAGLVVIQEIFGANAHIRHVAGQYAAAGYAVLGRWRERYDDVDYAQALDMLESLGAEHLAERRYGTLSEGERKRVLIARSLMTDPELLLLDEPAAGLDLGGREELVGRLADLAADPDAPAMVMVTHHVEEIPPGFSHCLMLAEGQVVAAGLLTDVLTAENLSKAFGQSIAVDVTDGRYFARRVRSRAAHRRRA